MTLGFGAKGAALSAGPNPISRSLLTRWWPSTKPGSFWSFGGSTLGGFLHSSRTAPNSKGECLPGARLAHARHTTFLLSILSLAPSLSSPWEVPQVARTTPQTFPARHLT